MTILVKAFQKKGVSTQELEDEFTFCCWDDLKKWLDKFEPHKCPKCKAHEEREKL